MTPQTLIEFKIVIPGEKYRVNGNIKKIMKTNPNIEQDIIDATRFINNGTINERIHCIMNNIQAIPKCLHCNNSTTYNKDKKRYNTFCSNACATSSSQRQLAIETTNQARYGCTTSLLNKEVNAKARDTMQAKYGAPYSGQSKSLREKRDTTCLRKYGAIHPSMGNFNEGVIGKLTDKQWLTDQHYKLNKSQWRISEELGVSQTTVHRWFNRHGIDAINTGVSSYEHKLVQDIKNVLPDIIVETNVRGIVGRKELDIVFPEHNLAIEVNGLYWHSENNGRARNYHIDKTRSAADNGYRLIHIYEHQLTGISYNIIISRLLAILGQSTKIHGRHCNVIETDNTTYAEFVNNTHIQGHANASVKLALVHNSKIVAVMSFGKNRFSRTVEWELLRYSCSQGITVVGGASKLFNYFVKHYKPNSIVSYSLLDWGRGALYGHLGFTEVGETGPSFWYITPHGDIVNRIKFQKHKLPTRLPSYDSSLSEWENMKSNGYDRLWNCGSVKWMWKRPA